MMLSFSLCISFYNATNKCCSSLKITIQQEMLKYIFHIEQSLKKILTKAIKYELLKICSVTFIFT